MPPDRRSHQARLFTAKPPVLPQVLLQRTLAPQVSRGSAR
jgi:hypothetical protein